MIVCSCNVLSDRDVRTAVNGSEPPRTTGQVYGCLGCSPQCGRCARTIRRIMDEAVAAAAGCPCRPQRRTNAPNFLNYSLTFSPASRLFRLARRGNCVQIRALLN